MYNMFWTHLSLQHIVQSSFGLKSLIWKMLGWECVLKPSREKERERKGGRVCEGSQSAAAIITCLARFPPPLLWAQLKRIKLDQLSHRQVLCLFFWCVNKSAPAAHWTIHHTPHPVKPHSADSFNRAMLSGIANRSHLSTQLCNYLRK